jgi:hypothetical protein
MIAETPQDRQAGDSKRQSFKHMFLNVNNNTLIQIRTTKTQRKIILVLVWLKRHHQIYLWWCLFYMLMRNLLLKMDNKTISSDAVPYHSGGIQTNGKVEVWAKITGEISSSPAI